MSNAARSFGRTILVASILAPALFLAGCGQSADQQMADQVAAAKEAANRAEKAQKAAEEAAKALIAKAPPGTFGEDEVSGDFDDSASYESSDSTDSSGMDASGDSSESTSSIPR